MPSPVLWGDEATVRDRFREGIAELKCTVRIYHFEYPFPPDAVVDFFRKNYGPVSRAFASLDAKGQEQLAEELVSLWSAHNKSEGNKTMVDAEYLEVVAIRPEVTSKFQTAAPSRASGRSPRRRRRRFGCLCGRALGSGMAYS